MNCRKNSPLTVVTNGRWSAPFAKLAHMFRCLIKVPEISKLTGTQINTKAVRGESSSAKLTEFFVRLGKTQDAVKASLSKL